MKTSWHRKALGASLALIGAKAAWGAETAAETSSAAEASSGLGLWAALAAAALLGVVVVGKIMRSRGGAGESLRVNGDAHHAAPEDVHANTPRGYSAKNVGNDASARPWERQGPALDAGTAAGSQGGYMGNEADDSASRLSEGFDTEAFLQASKANFVGLQAAWDRSDVASLRAMMTDGMLEQIQSQLAEREAHGGGMGQAPSEVVMLEARLLSLEVQGDDFIASVEFSGLLREGASAGPSPFRELWNITRPKAGGGWLVAGVQALQ